MMDSGIYKLAGVLSHGLLTGELHIIMTRFFTEPMRVVGQANIDAE